MKSRSGDRKRTKSVKSRAAIALALGLGWVVAGCGSGSASYSVLPSSKSVSQASAVTNNKVDVLWVVDNSGSMGPLQQNLTNNFASFMTSFQSKGFDYKMAVTTTESYLFAANFRNRPSMSLFSQGLSPFSGFSIVTPLTSNVLSTFEYNTTQGSSGSGDERAFQSMAAAFGDPNNAGFVRSGGFLAVVILSDEDDFTDYTREEMSWTMGGTPDHDYRNPSLISVNSTIAALDQMTSSTAASRHYNVSAITVLDEACKAQHIAASAVTIVGQRYMDIANATKGVLGSVCDASYASSLQFIQQRIVELTTTFALTRLPIPSTIDVIVNGGRVAPSSINGWTYDSVANSINFHGTGVPPASSSIQVNFDPVTIL